GAGVDISAPANLHAGGIREDRGVIVTATGSAAVSAAYASPETARRPPSRRRDTRALSSVLPTWRSVPTPRPPGTSLPGGTDRCPATPTAAWDSAPQTRATR